MLVDRVRTDGLQLTGEGGLLQQLTKRVLESALEGEITDHVGYDKHDATGRNSGTQVELTVSGGSMTNPVAARQPSTRCGRCWIFLSLRLVTRTRCLRSAAAKSASERLNSDQTPSTGLRSGAYEGSWNTRNHGSFSRANSPSCHAR